MVNWVTLGQSVQGAAHIRKNVPCQDSYLCPKTLKNKEPVILTVADGHGGAKYVRSAAGSEMACACACSVIKAYLRSSFKKSADNVIKELVETRLKVDIVKAWREAVLAHAQNNPFTDTELSAIGLSGGYDNNNADELSTQKVLSAYGSTLLIAVILDRMILCEQIGDGDILFYYHTGENAGVCRPIPQDNDLIANETTSLCLTGAARHFRHQVIYFYDKGNIPDLIMLSTDGYANSFNSTDDFFKAAKDYYCLLEEDGKEAVRGNLHQWLSETSQQGSGDDITLLMAWRDGCGKDKS